MAGKRTFKPKDWTVGDKDGWSTQREFSRRELGERHPFATVYGPRWLFWLVHGYGWLKIALVLGGLWAIGNGGIPVVSEVVWEILKFVGGLVRDAAREVWGYVWTGVVTVFWASVGWIVLVSVWGLAGFFAWRWVGWRAEGSGIGPREFTILWCLPLVVALCAIGVML